jgi:small subunit ribosomal protein S2
MKALLESGVHFGHRTNKWNPLMKPYIFTERNSIHIIDLQQTVKALNIAYNLVRETVAEGGVILFVGTKRQAQETITDETARCGMPYVTERWLGGTITNWITIQQRIRELERLERMRDSGELSVLTKKEGLMIEREIKRLSIRLSGIRNMSGNPDILFVVDVSQEETAIHEANLKNIPVLAMVDTNCDPRNVDYVIPANDDAIRAIKLVVSKMADAVIEGRALRKDAELEAELEAEKAAAFVESLPDEEELEEEDLLGEATLAKLSSTRSDEEIEAVDEAETAEETEDVEEEAAEAVEAEEEVSIPDEVEEVEEEEADVVEDIAEVEAEAETTELADEADESEIEDEAVEEDEAAETVESEEEIATTEEVEDAEAEEADVVEDTVEDEVEAETTELADEAEESEIEDEVVEEDEAAEAVESEEEIATMEDVEDAEAEEADVAEDTSEVEAEAETTELVDEAEEVKDEPDASGDEETADKEETGEE